MKNVRNIKQTITSIAVLVILTYIIFNTRDLITKMVIIPFIVFSFCFLLKKIFLILKKRKIAKIMEKIYVIAFFVYYFGFLIYWDYIAIINKNYMTLLFSKLPLFGGLYIIYKRFKSNNI